MIGEYCNCKSREIGFTVLLAVIGAVLAVGCWFLARGDANAPMRSSMAGFPVYSPLDDLSSVTDLVIVGTVNRVTARDLVYGTSDSDEKQYHPGEPVVLYEVAANETLKGSVAGYTIIVWSADVKQVIIVEASALLLGQEVIAIPRKRTSTPGVTTHNRDSECPEDSTPRNPWEELYARVPQTPPAHWHLGFNPSD